MEGSSSGSILSVLTHPLLSMLRHPGSDEPISMVSPRGAVSIGCHPVVWSVMTPADSTGEN